MNRFLHKTHTKNMDGKISCKQCNILDNKTLKKTKKLNLLKRKVLSEINI